MSSTPILDAYRREVAEVLLDVPLGSPLLTDAQKEALCERMRQAGLRYEAMRNGWSGADRADAEIHACERRVYLAVWQGAEFEQAIIEEDARWRTYAAEQARKVDEAPRLTRGGSSGQSAASYLWVSPEKFSDASHRIRRTVKTILSINAASR